MLGVIKQNEPLAASPLDTPSHLKSGNIFSILNLCPPTVLINLPCYYSSPPFDTSQLAMAATHAVFTAHKWTCWLQVDLYLSSTQFPQTTYCNPPKIVFNSSGPRKGYYSIPNTASKQRKLPVSPPALQTEKKHPKIAISYKSQLS